MNTSASCRRYRMRYAIVPAGDCLSIDDAGPRAQLRERLDNEGEAVSQIIPRTALEPHPFAFLAGDDPEAIVLDFVQPNRTVGRPWGHPWGGTAQQTPPARDAKATAWRHRNRAGKSRVSAGSFANSLRTELWPGQCLGARPAWGRCTGLWTSTTTAPAGCAGPRRGAPRRARPRRSRNRSRYAGDDRPVGRSVSIGQSPIDARLSGRILLLGSPCPLIVKAVVAVAVR
jgi:hypothetical protein